jgi:ornithine cyclodeaminase/alanine dehydrogenase-like protein (mu-crystallin family)
MLYLGKEHIRHAVSLTDLLDEVEKVLCQQEDGKFFMPPRMHFENDENTLLLMPCLTEKYFGTKLVTVFPNNKKHNVPSVNAVMVLNSAITGEPLAIIDGQTLTALRTGAVGGVGIRCLCHPEIERLGIVGTGVQGFNQAIFAVAARPVKDIYLFGRRPESVNRLIEKLTDALPETRIQAAASIESLLEFSQAVITATSSTEPVLPDIEALLKGKVFVGIGSYKKTMREFPESLFRLANRIFVDTLHATEESGDLTEPLSKGWITQDQVMPLGKFMLGEKGGVGKLGETYVFKSVGMALFDVGIAGLIYEKALALGLGQRLS